MGSLSFAQPKATYQSHQPLRQVALVALKEMLWSAQGRSCHITERTEHWDLDLQQASAPLSVLKGKV